MMKKVSPYYSVVIPIYNEEANLPELYRRLTETFSRQKLSYEIILVNDASADGSWGIIEKIVQKDSRVKGISFSRNFGQQSAVTAGLEVSGGEVIVMMDADLQDPPELLPDFFKKIDLGFDVVYGVSVSRHDPIFRKILFNGYYWMMNRLSAYPIPKQAGIFSVLKRPVADTILSMSEHNRFIPAIRSWVGFKQIGISYEKPARFAGIESQNIGKLFKMGLDALFSFSYIPLRLATILGLFSSVVAFLVILDVLYAKLFAGTAILGWASPMISTLSIGGIQLIILGIMGEYLGRIYDEVKRRPNFVISKKIGF